LSSHQVRGDGPVEGVRTIRRNVEVSPSLGDWLRDIFGVPRPNEWERFVPPVVHHVPPKRKVEPEPGPEPVQGGGVLGAVGRFFGGLLG
jgi:hypothetical protein